VTSVAPTICLSMIVKDEAPVIARCLDSVRPYIDSWAIIDTGSSDATREIVRERLADLTGELVERPWVDFAHNRSEALELARERARYILVIDADEALEADPGFRMPALTADSYDVEVSYDGVTYLRRQLLRGDLPWRYRGVLHEYVHCDEAATVGFVEGLRTIVRHDGARSRDPLTYKRDALVLEHALLDEPDNTRYAFYLAQSYRDAGNLEAAVRAYRRRVEMGGWNEEIWFSLYQIALARERLGAPWPEVMDAHLAAFAVCPDRAEPLFRIGVHYQAASEHVLAHLFLSRAMTIATPTQQRLFVERAIYDYLLPIEYGVAAHYVGDFPAAIATCNALLRSGALPGEAVGQVVCNRRFSLDAQQPAGAPTAISGLRVVIVARDAGTELELAVDSALQQDDARCEVTVLDDGSRADPQPRLPDHPRLRVVRNSPAVGALAALDAYVAGQCDSDDVVVAMPAARALASRATATLLATAFADSGCALVHGPHQFADGRSDAAEPASDEQSFEAAAARVDGSATLCFRASLWREASALGPVDGPALWRAAGLARTRFVDEPLTTELTATVRVRPAAPASDDRPPSPSVSCLMITRDRLALARLAIRCFAEQTHAARELVIVSEGDRWYRQALRRCADELGVEQLRIVTAERGTTLGALRNMSMDAADGEILCQWDDDDLSHPARLATQLQGMLAQRARACFLTDHIQYLERQHLALWIDWTLGGRTTDEMQLFPGTVMLYKEPHVRYPEEGPYARRGEDSIVVSQLFRTVPVARLPGMGHLYLYRYHGANTFDEAHHMRISSCCSPNAIIVPFADRIREALDYYPVSKPIVVAGADGPLLTVS
jgi:glycosyltransferase involved in cell wall biosynthesis